MGADSDRIQGIEERRQRILTRAVDLGLDKSWIGAPLSWQAVLDTVGRELTAKLSSAVPPLLMWQLLSGVAHGRQWATLAGLTREIVADNGDGTVTIKSTANDAVLYHALQTAAKLYRAGSSAYTSARLTWKESSPS